MHRTTKASSRLPSQTMLACRKNNIAAIFAEPVSCALKRLQCCLTNLSDSQHDQLLQLSWRHSAVAHTLCTAFRWAKFPLGTVQEANQYFPGNCSSMKNRTRLHSYMPLAAAVEFQNRVGGLQTEWKVGTSCNPVEDELITEVSVYSISFVGLIRVLLHSF
jgi:hypothetical protein